MNTIESIRFQNGITVTNINESKSKQISMVLLGEKPTYTTGTATPAATTPTNNHKRANSWKPWTNSEDEFLFNNRKQGIAYKAIAKVLGRTEQGVSLRFAKIKNQERFQ